MRTNLGRGFTEELVPFEKSGSDFHGAPGRNFGEFHHAGETGRIGSESRQVFPSRVDLNGAVLQVDSQLRRKRDIEPNGFPLRVKVRIQRSQGDGRGNDQFAFHLRHLLACGTDLEFDGLRSVPRQIDGNLHIGRRIWRKVGGLIKSRRTLQILGHDPETDGGSVLRAVAQRDENRAFAGKRRSQVEFLQSHSFLHTLLMKAEIA